jgi:hypothetical protein
MVVLGACGAIIDLYIRIACKVANISGCGNFLFDPIKIL